MTILYLQLETFGFETTNDVSNNVSLNTIGLDHA
jgi:hypothetical protein